MGTVLDHRSIGQGRRIKALSLPLRSIQELPHNIPQQARHIGLGLVERKPLVEVADRRLVKVADKPLGPLRRLVLLHKPLLRT